MKKVCLTHNDWGCSQFDAVMGQLSNRLIGKPIQAHGVVEAVAFCEGCEFSTEMPEGSAIASCRVCRSRYIHIAGASCPYCDDK